MRTDTPTRRKGTYTLYIAALGGALLLGSGGFGPSAAGATKSQKTSKASKAKKKPVRKATNAKSAGFITPPGAGQTLPPVSTGTIMNPESPSALRRQLSSQFLAPEWFPIPESITTNSKEISENTVGAFSVTQQQLPSTSRGTEGTFRTTVSIEYNFARTSAEQSVAWVKAQPGYPAFVYTPGKDTGGGLRSFDWYRSADVDMSVLSSAFTYKGKSRARTSIDTIVRSPTLPALPGLVPLADWPQGIAWEEIQVSMSHGFLNSDFRGTHSANVSFESNEIEPLKQALSNPANYTGTVKFVGNPTTIPNPYAEGYSTWQVEVSWLGRPGFCTVSVPPSESIDSRAALSANCFLNFDFL
jgi:hypothetical protein